MAELAAPLVLASASPRRREILATLGFAFEVVPSAIAEERFAGEDAERYVRRLSAAKALDVAARLGDRDVAPYVLGADTTVVVDGDVLEKPADVAEARSMIARLSGRTHRVVTGVSLVAPGGAEVETIAVETEVLFRALSEAEIDGYAASGEGADKAGAYGIQGIGSGLVSGLRGSYFNVVGLPAAEVVELLRARGALRQWP